MRRALSFACEIRFKMRFNMSFACEINTCSFSSFLKIELLNKVYLLVQRFSCIVLTLCQQIEQEHNMLVSISKIAYVGSNSFSYAIISLASVNQGSLSIRCSLIQDASYQKVLVRNLICLMKQCIVKADTLLFHKLLYLLVMHFTKGAKSVRFHQR